MILQSASLVINSQEVEDTTSVEQSACYLLVNEWLKSLYNESKQALECFADLQIQFWSANKDDEKIRGR